MRNLLVLALVLSLLALPGCLNPPETPGQNATPQPNATPPAGNVSNITVIITPQENLTIIQNYTPPPPPPESTELNYTFEPDAPLAAYFIYVGDMQNKLQGDAILIRKGDLEVLVDAGPAQTSNRVLDFLNRRGVDDIDVLISTNADPSHYGGIPAVMSAYRVEEYWWSGKDFGDPEYNAMGTSPSNVAGKVKTVRTIGRGFSMSLNGMTFTALNPKDPPFNNVDNDAIVLRVQDRNFSIVLLSGVEFGAQNEMLNNQKDLLKADVMQAPHYGLGSGTSGIGNFLKTLMPGTVVVSGGPDDSALSGGSRQPFRQTMTDYGIPYYENYRNGTVRVVSDGKTYSAGYFPS